LFGCTPSHALRVPPPVLCFVLPGLRGADHRRGEQRCPQRVVGHGGGGWGDHSGGDEDSSPIGAPDAVFRGGGVGSSAIAQLSASVRRRGPVYLDWGSPPQAAAYPVAPPPPPPFLMGLGDYAMPQLLYAGECVAGRLWEGPACAEQ
jgi:hypothetical protein